MLSIFYTHLNDGSYIRKEIYMVYIVVEFLYWGHEFQRDELKAAFQTEKAAKEWIAANAHPSDMEFEYWYTIKQLPLQ